LADDEAKMCSKDGSSRKLDQPPEMGMESKQVAASPELGMRPPLRCAVGTFLSAAIVI
jgi:hypothetical protein